MSIPGAEELRRRDGDLWERWEKHHGDLGMGSGLVSDGVADPDTYDAEPTRILFVLKEPNNTSGKFSDVDARSQLLSGAKFRVWHNVARWAVGLMDGFPPYASINAAQKNAALTRIAAINLKKIPGGSSADTDSVAAMAYLDRELLEEQIRKTIRPHRIIACGEGVFTSLLWLLELEFDRSLKRRYAQDANGTVVVRWSHPAKRGSSEAMYEGLKDLTQHIDDELGT